MRGSKHEEREKFMELVFNSILTTQSFPSSVNVAMEGGRVLCALFTMLAVQETTAVQAASKIL